MLGPQEGCAFAALHIFEADIGVHGKTVWRAVCLSCSTGLMLEQFAEDERRNMCGPPPCVVARNTYAIHSAQHVIRGVLSEADLFRVDEVVGEAQGGDVPAISVFLCCTFQLKTLSKASAVHMAMQAFVTVLSPVAQDERSSK